MCSRRVLQILSEQANVLLKIANFHCFEIVLKSLFDVANYLHKDFEMAETRGARRSPNFRTASTVGPHFLIVRLLHRWFWQVVAACCTVTSVAAGATSTLQCAESFFWNCFTASWLRGSRLNFWWNSSQWSFLGLSTIELLRRVTTRDEHSLIIKRVGPYLRL